MKWDAPSPGVKAAAAWIVVSAVAVGASTLSAHNGRPPQIFLPVGLTGLVYAAAGALIYRRRPDNLTGPMLLAVAALSTGLVVVRYLFPILVPFTQSFGTGVNLLPLVYVVLSFPSGRLVGVVERRVMLALVGLTLAVGLAEALTIEPIVHLPPNSCEPCTENPVRLIDPAVYPYVATTGAASYIAGVVLAAGAAVRRWSLARGVTRTALTPVIGGGLVLAAVTLVLLVTDLVAAEVPLTGQILLLVRVLIPIGLAIVFMRLFTARSGVARAVIELGRGTSVPRLEAALREELRDPAISVALWSPAAEAYFDSEGRRIDIGRERDAGGVLEIERDRAPLAAVLHDPGLANDPKLLKAVADAARFALDVTALREELSARGGDVDRLPRGEVAFLFGDVEGSTEILARLGDAYGLALAEIRRRIRAAAGRHSGYVVDVRADECFLAFGGGTLKTAALAAVAAAIEIQRDLRAGTRPTTAMRLRIGLHVGRPELDRDGYAGLDVHRAARVMSAAHGGQIVASESVAQAIGGGLPLDVELVSLGNVQLRGLPGDDVLHQVVAPGLQRDFPPPRGVVRGQATG